MKLKHVLIILPFLILSLFAVFIGLYFAGALPSTVTYSIDHIIARFQTQSPNGSVPANTPAFIYESTQAVSLPESSYAVTLDLNTDLKTPADGTATYGTLVAEIEQYFNDFRNYIADTVYITPDYGNKYASFTDAYGNRVDVLRDCMKYCDAAGYFKVLVLTDECIYKNNKLTFDQVDAFLGNYGFNAVLLNGGSLADPAKLKEAAAFFAPQIRNKYPDIHFGAVLPSSASAKYAEPDTLAVVASGNIDFAAIEGSAIKNGALPFKAVMNSWNILAANNPHVKFYCIHRCDLLCSNGSDWTDDSEINNQVRYIWECENFYGSVFHSASALLKDKSTSSRRLAYLLFDGAAEDLSVNTLYIDPESNSVQFTGTGAAGKKITCNRKPLTTAGAFTATEKLQAGENTFRFFSAGKTLTYRVYNNAEIIYSYYPQEDTRIPAGDMLYVTAVCLDGAKVTCTLNGQFYDMTKSYTLETTDIPQGYRLYSCGIKLTGSREDDIDLGSVIISAFLNDTTETVTAGAVTVSGSEQSGFFTNLGNIFSPTPAAQSSPVQKNYSGVSPFRDNGLGKAILCRILNDSTEQLGLLNEKDTYHADASVLTAGTIDYLESMDVSEKGYLRYKLRSGITVYGVNCELISNAYVLPNNNIVVDHVDDSNSSATDIVFKTDWLSPITVKCSPQKYSRGYSGYSYNISSFTAEYVDVKFFYAGDFYNSSLLSFAADSVFSHAELYKEGETNLILRLYLKKPGQFYGFNISRNEIGQVVISFKKHANASLQGKTIMLDAGHGGRSMTGTALNDNSVAEKTVTLAIALKAKPMLESKGATVIMTRFFDTSLTLEERAELLRKYNPDVFVSVHCDGIDNIEDAGTHSFYFRPYSQPLAKAINDAMASVYKTHIYTPADANYAKVDKPIKYYPFYVTRMNNCPAVLLETGFMTNPVEGMILAQDNAQYWFASGLVNGIESYFMNNY